MRDGYMMAWQLAKHAHPGGLHFIDALADSTRHPDALAMLRRLRRVSEFLSGLPELARIRADRALFERLYATSGYLLDIGTRHPEDLLLVFCTAYNSFGISNLGLLGTVREFGVSCLMVKDPSPENYLGGVHGMGSSLDETLDKINGLLQQHRFRRIAITGYSSGGFASAYASAKLPCAAYLGFSIPTDFRDDATPRTDFFLKRDRRIKHARQYRVHLRDLFAETQSGPRRRLLVGSRSPRDVAAARAMEGVAGLEVLELAECAHDTPESFIAAGRFMEQLEWLLRDD
jgi:hypothetical protein